MKTTNIKQLLDKTEEKLGQLSKRTMILALAAALVLSGAGFATYAALSQRRPTVAATQTAYDDGETSAVTDDTVYVIAGADGSAEKIIVSDWMKNGGKGKNVAQVGETDGYGMDTENAYQWNTDGGEITGSDQLPVSVKLTYLLDGKEMTAEEIAGKSGRATIRFDYTNNQKQTVSIDGTDEDIYVPFTVVTGAILDDNVFSNVEISNGKIINDGTRSIVIGFALPGMQESLHLNQASIDIPENIEITADVKNFALTTTLTMVSNDLFNEASEKAEEKKAEKGGADLSLGALSSGINQLTDGSSALYDGTSQLLQKSGLLIEGIHQLAEGGQQVSGGVDTVRQTLAFLCSNNADLQGGAAKVFDTLLATTQQQIQAAGMDCPALSRDNYAAVLGSIVSGLSEESLRGQAEAAAREAVAAQVEANTAAITEQVTGTVQEQVRQGVLGSVLESKGLTSGDYQNADEATRAEIDSTVEQYTQQQMQSEEVQATIQNNVNGTKQQLIEQNMNSDAIRSQINQALAANLPKAKEGQESINAALKQLNAYNEFYQGICQYTNGVQALYDGTAQLQEGAKSLSDGLNQVDGSSGALTDGINRLNSGAMQLSDGMKQFKGSSLEKLATMANGDVAGLGVRWQALKDVSRSYSAHFSADGQTEESVKFIYRTDAVE